MCLSLQCRPHRSTRLSLLCLRSEHISLQHYWQTCAEIDEEPCPGLLTLKIQKLGLEFADILGVEPPKHNK